MKFLQIPILLFITLLLSCNSSETSYEPDDYSDVFASSVEESMSPTDEYDAAPESIEGSFGISNSASYSQKTELKDGDLNSQNGVITNSSKISTSDLNVNKYNTKIIKNADLKIKVEDVKKSSNKIANLVDMNGGYISNENLVSDKNYYQLLKSTDEFETKEYEIVTSNIIYIRIPSKNFQKLIGSMKGLAISEDYMRVNAQDVTEEYYDLETRLKTKKEIEARYIAILKAKAKTLEEILLAEEKIRHIREEIESVEGRLKFLKNKVSLSTIQIEVYQDTYYTQETTRYQKVESTGWSFQDKAGNAISNGWNGILWFLVGLLNIWPFLLIGIGILYILKRKISKRKSK